MEIKTSNIKKKREASLAYAYDENNVYTTASQAMSGQSYFCPFCKCPMHLVTSKTGKRYFARNPHQVHTNSICITIENNGKEHSFANLDPEQFITSLCHVTPRTKKGTPKGSDGIDPGTPVKTPHAENDDFTLMRFTSLKQIAESGIEHLNANDIQGTHRISDFIITFKYAEELFAQPDFDLGPRIVYASYNFADSATKSILFRLYSPKFSLRFRLIFTSLNDFKKVRDKFGTFIIDESGRTKFQKHFKTQNVLIASDHWDQIPTPRCQQSCKASKDFCDTCSGMYQAVYTNAKQLYLIPTDH